MKDVDTKIKLRLEWAFKELNNYRLYWDWETRKIKD